MMPNLNSKPINLMTKEEFITLIIDRCCDCDIMNGWNCGHTKLYDELQRRIPSEVKLKANGDIDYSV